MLWKTGFLLSLFNDPLNLKKKDGIEQTLLDSPMSGVSNFEAHTQRVDMSRLILNLSLSVPGCMGSLC